MEVVWHGHYVKYLEIVRGVLLDSIDYNYAQMKASGYLWPVIDLHLRYVAPGDLPTTAQAARRDRRVGEPSENRLPHHRRRHRPPPERAPPPRKWRWRSPAGEMCFVSPPVLFEKLGVAPS